MEVKFRRTGFAFIRKAMEGVKVLQLRGPGERFIVLRAEDYYPEREGRNGEKEDRRTLPSLESKDPIP